MIIDLKRKYSIKYDYYRQGLTTFLKQESTILKVKLVKIMVQIKRHNVPTNLIIIN
jgi:hypothetical protein